MHAYKMVVDIFIIFVTSREHLSEEDLRKNKALLEGLTKGQLVDNQMVIT